VDAQGEAGRARLEYRRGRGWAGGGRVHLKGSPSLKHGRATERSPMV